MLTASSRADAASGAYAYAKSSSTASAAASGAIAAALLMAAALMTGGSRVPATLLALGMVFRSLPSGHEGHPLVLLAQTCPESSLHQNAC
jgi:hypothetical protein